MSYDPLTFSWQSTPALWACYYDPEGPSGHGKTREAAVLDLFCQCDDEHTPNLLAGSIVAAIDKPERELAEALRLVKASEVILGLWSETELDPEDEDYEHFMAAFNESVTGYLKDARAALQGHARDCGQLDASETGKPPYCPCCTCGACRDESARRLSTDHGRREGVDTSPPGCTSEVKP